MKRHLNHESLKAQAKHDQLSAQEELLEELKSYSKSDLYHVDPATLSRLTQAQRIELFSASKQPKLTPSSHQPETKSKAFKRPSLLVKIWHKLPLTIRASLFGCGFTALFALPLSIPLIKEDWFRAIVFQGEVLPLDIARWPDCRRLSPHVDGCLYQSESVLDWQQLSQKLDIRLEQIQSTNRHLNSAKPIPAGSSILIWRDQLQWEGNQHEQ